MARTAPSDTLRQRFVALWRTCSTQDDAVATWEILHRHYGEPHRHYHDLGHIAFCLDQLDQAVALLDSPLAVELAVWFHDVVYRPGTGDNEAASAALFRERAGAFDPGLVETVTSLILDTTHLDMPVTADGRYMVDIDLASLGLPWPRFCRDSAAIREEQRGIPDARVLAAQIDFLQGLMGRPGLYRTRHFRDRYEATARANITRTLEEQAA